MAGMPQVGPLLGVLVGVSLVVISGLQFSTALLGSGKIVCAVLVLPVCMPLTTTGLESHRMFPMMLVLLAAHATEPTLRLPPGVVSAPLQLLNVPAMTAFGV